MAICTHRGPENCEIETTGSEPRLNLAAGEYSLQQLCVLGFGLFKDRNVGVGILP